LSSAGKAQNAEKNVRRRTDVPKIKNKVNSSFDNEEDYGSF